MNRETTIEQIISIINKIEDAEALKDILTLAKMIYRHSRSGTWGR